MLTTLLSFTPPPARTCFTLWVVQTMPKLTSSAKKASLKAATEAAKISRAAKSGDMETIQEALVEAKAQISELEAQLAASNSKYQELSNEISGILDEKEMKISQLSGMVEKKDKRICELSKQLSVSKDKVKKWYRALRTERQARNRSDNKKDVLKQQIHDLQEAKSSIEKEKKSIQSHAFKTVESLIQAEKKNNILQSELSGALQRSAAELAAANSRSMELNKEAHKSRAFGYRLQKRYGKAISTKKIAVAQALEKWEKEKSTFSLLDKGVYTQETRNLVRLLIQCGCQKDYINQVIHGVLKCAGITATGHISRRSVSRILAEGYIAAKIQLGYEMQESEGRHIKIMLIYMYIL